MKTAPKRCVAGGNKQKEWPPGAKSKGKAWKSMEWAARAALPLCTTTVKWLKSLSRENGGVQLLRGSCYSHCFPSPLENLMSFALNSNARHNCKIKVYTKPKRSRKSGKFTWERSFAYLVGACVWVITSLGAVEMFLISCLRTRGFKKLFF